MPSLSSVLNSNSSCQVCRDHVDPQLATRCLNNHAFHYHCVTIRMRDRLCVLCGEIVPYTRNGRGVTHRTPPRLGGIADAPIVVEDDDGRGASAPSTLAPGPSSRRLRRRLDANADAPIVVEDDDGRGASAQGALAREGGAPPSASPADGGVGDGGEDHPGSPDSPSAFEWEDPEDYDHDCFGAAAAPPPPSAVTLRNCELGKILAEQTCAICLAPMISGDPPAHITVVTCHHAFHMRCMLLREIGNMPRGCPICQVLRGLPRSGPEGDGRVGLGAAAPDPPLPAAFRNDVLGEFLSRQTCAICLGSVSGDVPPTDVAITSCLHVFHMACIYTWLGRGARVRCPTCRGVQNDHW